MCEREMGVRCRPVAQEAIMLSVALDESTKAGNFSPVALAGVLKIGMGDLAALARVHRNTLLRNPGSPVVQTRLGEIATILARATEMLGDKDTARAVIWFRHQPMTGWGGKTAAALVTEGRPDLVMWELESLEAGVFA